MVLAAEFDDRKYENTPWYQTNPLDVRLRALKELQSKLSMDVPPYDDGLWETWLVMNSEYYTTLEKTERYKYLDKIQKTICLMFLEEGISLTKRITFPYGLSFPRASKGSRVNTDALRLFPVDISSAFRDSIALGNSLCALSGYLVCLPQDGYKLTKR